MATHVSHLCRAAILVNRSVSLFSHRRDLPARISGLLDVGVDANNGVPLHGCCKCQLETLEKAAGDFQMQARDTYARSYLVEEV